MTDKKELTGGWKVGDPYSESRQTEFVKQMVEETLAGNRPPPRVVPTHFNGKLLSDLSSEEWGDFQFSLQAKSTQEALTRQKTRDEKDDLEFSLRPIPLDYLANPEAEDLNELTAKRSLDASDIAHHNHLKQGRNTIGKSVYSSLSKEKRKSAVNAFTYSKPASPSTADLKRLTKSEAVESVQPTNENDEIVEAPKRSLLGRIFDYIFPRIPGQ
jgi:hypothetical protein